MDGLLGCHRPSLWYVNTRTGVPPRCTQTSSRSVCTERAKCALGSLRTNAAEQPMCICFIEHATMGPSDYKGKSSERGLLKRAKRRARSRSSSPLETFNISVISILVVRQYWLGTSSPSLGTHLFHDFPRVSKLVNSKGIQHPCKNVCDSFFGREGERFRFSQASKKRWVTLEEYIYMVEGSLDI